MVKTLGGTYRKRAAHHFTQGSRANAAAYGPGEKADAFPGSPVFQHHVTVVWYPGNLEEIVVHAGADQQDAWLAEFYA